jgi:hypothetical protein
VPAVAYADDDSDSDRDRHKPKVVHVCHTKHAPKLPWWWCPKPAEKPAEAPKPEVTITAPAGDPLIQVINNVGVSGSGPAAGQVTTAQGQPLPAAAAAAAPAGAPITAASTSRTGPCERRRVFRLTLHKGKARRARVLLNGRAISVTRGRRSTSVLLDLRGRANTAFTVRHTVVTKTGRLKTGTRRFRTCG